MKNRMLVIYLISIVCLSAKGQTVDSILNSPQIYERVGTEKITYRMMFKGDSAGYTLAQYANNPEQVSFSEEAKALVNNSSIIKEVLSLTYDTKDKKAVQTHIEMDFNGSASTTDAKWVSKNKVSVSINKLDTTLSIPSHLTRTFGIMILPKLIHDSRESIEYNQFYPIDLKIRNVRFEHLAYDVVIETPLGSFNTNVIKATGGVAEQTFFVDTESHRIVRIDIPKSGWTYELIQIQKKF